MRAISVGHTLGFRNFKLYGFDCSVPEPKNKDEKIVQEKEIFICNNK